MAEESNNSIPQKIKTSVIAPDAIVTIEVSGYFLNRIQGALTAMCGEVGERETLEILKRMREDEQVHSTQEEAIGIFLALVHAIETSALEQGKAVEKELSPEEALQLFEMYKEQELKKYNPTGN
jgi:hypothetical protein